MDDRGFVDHVVQRSGGIIQDLKADEVIGGYIDDSFPVPRPFVGTGPTRLVVIGQDPTIERLESRRRVTTVLTLNQQRSPLYKFVSRISTGLGLSLQQHVYATNLCKNFFTALPEKVSEPDLIGISWPKWQSLLAEELARFPAATVVTLGNPVLRTLVCPPASHDLRRYWGHVRGWKTRGVQGFSGVDDTASILGRRLFPFPHITNSRKTALYRRQFDGFLSFVRAEIDGERS